MTGEIPSKEFDQKAQPSSFSECFSLDEHASNPIPKGWLRKFRSLFLSSRYSMPVLMRLSQFYYLTSQKEFTKIGQKVRGLLSVMLRRANVIVNQFEHGANPQIAAGVVFHHTGVCITSDTMIESGVHIYRNVTLGIKDGGAPYIKQGAKISSHSIVLGNVVVGEKAIVAPGAVVVKDVPARKVAAGVPSRIIGDVTDSNFQF